MSLTDKSEISYNIVRFWNEIYLNAVLLGHFSFSVNDCFTAIFWSTYKFLSCLSSSFPVIPFVAPFNGLCLNSLLISLFASSSSFSVFTYQFHHFQIIHTFCTQTIFPFSSTYILWKLTIFFAAFAPYFRSVFNHTTIKTPNQSFIHPISTSEDIKKNYFHVVFI